MAAEKKRIGRPPLPKGEKRSITLTVQIRPRELKELRELAEREQVTVSDLVRRRLFSAFSVPA